MSETYPRKNPCETLFVGHTSSIVDSTAKVILFFDIRKYGKQNLCFLVGISPIGQMRQIGGKISLKGIERV